MPVPVIGDTNATRADATATFRTQITDPVNAISKWHATNNPAGANVPLGGLSSASPALLSAVLLNTNVVTNSPTTAEFTFSTLSTSALGTLFQNAAIVLSRARNVRLVKYYSDTNSGTNNIFFDQTAVSHLNSAYQLSSTGVTTPTGTVSASAFNTFVSQLQTAVTNHRNATLTFTEQWCHSSCHSSHSSRGRR